MFGLKNKIILGVLIAILGALFILIKKYSIVKTKTLTGYETTRKKDSTSVATLSKELGVKDSLYFGSQDLVEIKNGNIQDLQTLNKNLVNENKRLRSNESSCCAEVQQLESNGMIKHDTVFIAKINKVFKKDEWVQVPRPDKVILKAKQ
jgi:hypothetical protein